jgi:general secretion pathway protein G
MSRRRSALKTMIVMAITLFVSVAIPMYSRSLRRSKESVLKNNLFTLRTVIQEYTHDEQKTPRTLRDLVTDGYLRQVPIDPMTGNSNSWIVIIKNAPSIVNQTDPGIFDVRSGSDKISVEGTRYSDW